ncbi:14-3-3 protein 9 [Tanacetum coccineum]
MWIAGNLRNKLEYGSCFKHHSQSGSRSIVYVKSIQDFHETVGVFPVKVVDTTGVGDSFVGALLAKIVDDQSVLQLASTTSEADLSLTHPIRLGLTFNFFVFYYKNMNPPESTKLATLSEEPYKDNILHSQFPKDALRKSLRDQMLKKLLIWLLSLKHFNIVAGNMA